ncbi:MAG: hypothetical protein ACPG8W_19675 [Candidatus Promineifilaceae bacterium]
MTNEHPFEIGDSYDHPKFGRYEVLAFEGERMQVQFADGSKKSLKITIQTRIWRNAQHDVESAEILLTQARQRRYTRGGKTEPVRLLVQDILYMFATPFPKDIIEQVCLKIENDTELRRRYDELVEIFDRTTSDGRSVVNNWIGKYTARLTSMVTVTQVDAKRATIITGFSLLKPATVAIN